MKREEVKKSDKSNLKLLSAEDTSKISGGAEGGGRNSRNSFGGTGSRRKTRQFAGGRGSQGK